MFLTVWFLVEPREINKQLLLTNSRFFMDFIENIRDIYIGEIIKEKLTEKSMTITGFADKINKERSTVHDIFMRKSIDTELLIEISKTLGYDFIRKVYYAENTTPTILISITTEEDLLKKMNLIEEFICFLKSKQ